MRLYNEDGKELEEIEAEERIERFWKQTYQTHQNKINNIIINKMIQEKDLILLNIDSRCKGTYTWQ